MEYARYEQLWERMLELLSTWARAEEIAPGRVRVHVDDATGRSREVTLVMTRDEWHDIASVMYGGFEGAADALLGWIRAAPADHPFLVYSGEYDLQPSKSEGLPPPEDELRMEELRRKHPDDGPIGRWYAYPPGDPRNDRPDAPPLAD